MSKIVHHNKKARLPVLNHSTQSLFSRKLEHGARGGPGTYFCSILINYGNKNLLIISWYFSISFL